MTPKNPKGKNFSWSPSAVSDYINCPRQYAARRYYETLPYVETPQMKAGNIEHKHLELRLKNKTPLPEGFTRGEKYCQSFENSGGVIIAEQELAIDRDLRFVSWFSKQAWGRCKIDVSLIFPKRLHFYDWKVGRIKEDLLQLKINSCFMALKHQEAEEFITRYIWLAYDSVTPFDGNFKKSDIPNLWEEVLSWVSRMEQAWATETFEPKPSGLCRSYCAVTSCEYCGKGGKR